MLRILERVAPPFQSKAAGSASLSLIVRRQWSYALLCGPCVAFMRQRRQDSSAKGNALVTRAPHIPRPERARLERVLPFQGVEWFGWAGSPGRWPGLTSGGTFGAGAMMEMRQPSPNKAGAGNRAGALSFHIGRFGRAVPDLFRSGTNRGATKA
jgi:hypothetical protein